jgi:uncharacterized repeat protein (TIGR03803 family)
LAGLVQGSDGIFYGTTSGFGEYGVISSPGYGTVFKISTNGMLTSLYSFTNGFDGACPLAGLVQGSDGIFYGTTSGTQACPTCFHDAVTDGTVFNISTNGTLTSLYSFTNGNDGASPWAGLGQGSDGYFYGTTVYGGVDGNGTVFRISTDGALTSLYSFTNGNDGANPYGALVQGRDGNFYGATLFGGSNNLDAGTVFKISADGTFTSLYSFTGTNDGCGPLGLVQGSDGSLYGATSVEMTLNRTYGGNGSVFKIGTNGALTSLYSFTGGNDGGLPNGGLVQGSNGSFYGTTEYGGQGGAGTVFRLTIVPEFQAGTLSNNTLNLTWSTERGGVYQLQWNSDLSSTNWSNLGSHLTATGATLSTTDIIMNGPQQFYRLVLSP